MVGRKTIANRKDSGMRPNRNDGHNPTAADPHPAEHRAGQRCPSVRLWKSSTILWPNEAVLTLKTRSAHWNVSGAGFFELHILFDSQYKQLNDISDEIAERARMLGGIAIGSLQEFLHYHPAGGTARGCSGHSASFGRP